MTKSLAICQANQLICLRPSAEKNAAMALRFPNKKADALRRVQPGMRFTEAGLLAAFDANRDLICAAAAKVYARGWKGSYDLWVV